MVSKYRVVPFHSLMILFMVLLEKHYTGHHKKFRIIRKYQLKAYDVKG